MIQLEPMGRDEVNMFTIDGLAISQIERMKISLIWEI